MNKDYNNEDFTTDSLVAYRGGDATKEATQGQAGRGIYFTTNSVEAKKYSNNVSEVTLGKLKLKTVNRKDIPMDNTYWNESIRRDGYDGILLREASGDTEEFIIFDKNKIADIKELEAKEPYQALKTEECQLPEPIVKMDDGEIVLMADMNDGSSCDVHE